MIVDDEPLGRRGVNLRLRKFEDTEIVGECGDGPAAVEQILERVPDVVFLDVQMPGMDGFEVLRALPREKLPGIIFLTAYEQHALRAFEFHALDYLLKPVDDARFAAAIGRARKLAEGALRTKMAERVLQMLDQSVDENVSEKKSEAERTGRYVSRFAVPSGSRIQVVAAEDVQWIAAAGDYVELHARGRVHLLRETMSALEQKLDPEKFLRIHRSRIVSTGSVVELQSTENREYIVKISDGTEHRSGRTYTERLERWLSFGKR